MSVFFLLADRGARELAFEAEYSCLHTPCDQNFRSASLLNEHYKTHLDKSIDERKEFAPWQPQNYQFLGTVPSKFVFNHDTDYYMGAHPFNNAVHPTAVFDINGFITGSDYSDALTDGFVSPGHDKDGIQFIDNLIPGTYSGDVSGFDDQLSTTPMYPDSFMRKFAPPCSVESSDLISPLVHGNDQECGCIPCLEERIDLNLRNLRNLGGFTCPVPDCNNENRPDRNQHYGNFDEHFKQGDEKYACNAPDCGHVSKRWLDLRRHSRTHCVRSPQFPCNEVGCSRGGDSGFHRKDKLMDHQRKVHQGNMAPKHPGQAMRPLQPRVQK